MYDETDNKSYETPVLIHSLVTIDDSTWQNEDYGLDTTQTAQFSFLLDDLVDKNVRPEVGDVIEYKSRFFEIDGENENQYLELFVTAKKVIGVSKEICSQLINLGCPKEKIHYLPCYLNLDIFQYSDHSNNPPVFLSVGRLSAHSTAR